MRPDWSKWSQSLEKHFNMTSIRDVKELVGKRVLVRVDYNVPIKDGVVEDDFRIKAVLPTVQYLREQGAKTIIMTHLGRPKGQVDESLRTTPIAAALSLLIGTPVDTVDELVGDAVEHAIAQMDNGGVLLLENTRFSPEEKDNTGTLGKELASLADLFVLECFAVAHRADASVVGVAEHLPTYAGILFEKETTILSGLLEHPRRPFVVLLGGKKIGTKIGVLENLTKHADTILVGGALINTYLHAKGYSIGDSIIDEKYAEQAIAYMEVGNVVTPIDWVVGQFDGKKTRVVKDDGSLEICEPGEAIFDVGPATVKKYKEALAGAGAIVWNGAMGMFEQKPYHKGTNELAKAVAEESHVGAYTIIGGGETLLASGKLGILDDMNHVSTGGGAMLEFLAGETLPGITALS